jgi:hypothetical protein
MSPSYRHVPLSQRLGISFQESHYWLVNMDHAECFMFFVAGLRQVFGDADTLYVEGLDLDQEVEAVYKRFQLPSSTPVMRHLRHPKARVYHVPLSRQAHAELSRLATCKTFAEICDVLMVHRDGRILMDGSRIGDRVVRFSPEIPEAKIKKFASTRLRGSYEWVEEA